MNPNQLGKSPFPFSASQWMLVGLRGTPPPTGLSDGDAVTSWTDSSGNGHTAANTGTARPIFKTNIINGKPVVRFTSAAFSRLNLSPAISSVGEFTIFAVMKPVSAGVNLVSLATSTAFNPMGPFGSTDGSMFGGNRTIYTNVSPVNMGAYQSAFHVFTDSAGPVNVFVDGTLKPTSSGANASTGDFDVIGVDDISATAGGPFYSNGDIAEILCYSGSLSLRVKLTLLLTLLLTTGEFPSPAEFDAMVGNRHRIRHYLHQHGAHPTNAQLDAVVEPFAVGDRANIEKYLGTKYGITVAGGTNIDPTTVAGLVGWWKADSLL